MTTKARTSSGLSFEVRAEDRNRETPAQLTKGLQTVRCLKVFAEFDKHNTGKIPSTQFREAFAQIGFQLTARELRKFLSEVDASFSKDLGFQSFCSLCVALAALRTKYRPKPNKLPRMYLSKEQFHSYAALFKGAAGSSQQLSAQAVQELLADHHISVPAERLLPIIEEIDDDQSGFLDVDDFLVLVFKALGLKKRKIGPGQCPLASLRDDGWPFEDLKRVGYEYKDFVDARCSLADVLEQFTAVELRRAGVGLAELVAAGWDCVGAREAGYELSEAKAAKCSIQLLRDAGWDDVASAAWLRKNGFECSRMRECGWSMSELWHAGYSLADLRIAGFSSKGLVGLKRYLESHKSGQQAAEGRGDLSSR